MSAVTYDIVMRIERRAFALDVVIRTDSRCVGIHAPVGSGKTTVLHALAGLIKPTDGHIRIDGRCYFESTGRLHLLPEQRRVGYVFQDIRLFPHMSVKRNLLYGNSATNRSTVSQKDSSWNFAELVERLELNGLLERPAMELSGGERKKTAIARALLSQPDVLLLDEPYAGLDAAGARTLNGLIRSAITDFDLPVIITAHQSDQLISITDSLYSIESNRLQVTADDSD